MPKKAKRAINVSLPATPAKLAKQQRKLTTPIPANKQLAVSAETLKYRALVSAEAEKTGKPEREIHARIEAELRSAEASANQAADVQKRIAKHVTPETDAATLPRGLTRDAAGIVRYATNFDQYSCRDTAYLVFIGAVCRANNGTATLRQIHDSGVTRSGMPDRKRYNPNYTGSAKATDVGAINRLCKAGYFTRSADGNMLTPTKLALDSKAYLGTI